MVKQYVTAEQINPLTRGFPAKSKEVYRSFVDFPEILEKYGFTTPNRIAAILATALAEMGASELRENMNYSAKRILQVWPSRPAAARFAHNPKALANSVYGKRMGNRPNTDDGFNYRGGGMVQTTGRSAYAHLQEITGEPFLEHPELVEQPRNALIALCAESKKFMKFADMGADGFRAFSNGINRGNVYSSNAPIGWALRKAMYTKVARVLGQTTAPRADTDNAATMGSTGEDIMRAQERLAELGYAMVSSKDGVLGPRTRSALLTFQAENGLAKTGSLDGTTVIALYSDTAKPMPAGDEVHEGAEYLRKAGSETVKGADAVQTAGAVASGVGAVAGVIKAIDVNQVAEHVGKVEEVQGVASRVSDIALWAVDHWYLLAIVGGAYLIYLGYGIIRARVASHQSGTDTGR